MTQLADHIAHARGPSGPNKVRAHSASESSFEGVPGLAVWRKKFLLNLDPPPNKQEYLYNLTAAVRLLCPASEDAYLAQLERLVRERDPDSSSSPSSSSSSAAAPPPLLQSKVVGPVTTATTAGSPDRLGVRM